MYSLDSEKDLEKEIAFDLLLVVQVQPIHCYTDNSSLHSRCQNLFIRANLVRRNLAYPKFFLHTTSQNVEELEFITDDCKNAKTLV